MKLILILVMGTHAHAGWWKNFCERHLVAHDPTQFESKETSVEWLLREHQRYATKDHWGKLTDEERPLYNIVHNEIVFRSQFGSEHDRLTIIYSSVDLIRR